MSTYRQICDRCGREMRSSEGRREWTGLVVCPEDFDYRHPQDFVRGRADRQNVPNPRPEATDVFVYPGMWWFTDYDQSGHVLTM